MAFEDVDVKAIRTTLEGLSSKLDELRRYL
jgi:hypothetical protein